MLLKFHNGTQSQVRRCRDAPRRRRRPPPPQRNAAAPRAAAADRRAVARLSIRPRARHRTAVAAGSAAPAVCGSAACLHMAQPRPRILTDADTGADDALSILLACALGDVLAISCTDGNVTSATATDNTLRLLEAAEYTGHVVAQGLTWPSSEGRHWGRSFADAFPQPPQLLAVPTPAAQVLVEQALAQPPGSVTLVCTGPLENVGAAIQYAEELGKLRQFMDSFAKVVVMGGLVNPASYDGALPNNAEFNFRACVEGSQRLWAAPWGESVEFFLVPIDPISRSPLTHQDAMKIKEMAAAGSARARAAWAVLDLHVRSDECQAQESGFEIYDAFAMALALDTAIGATLVPATVILQ
jgi:inosine-uridine nucleoside N-ribohydrolase